MKILSAVTRARAQRVLKSLIYSDSGTTHLTRVIVVESGEFYKRQILEFRLEKLYNYAPFAPIERFKSL